MPHQQYNMIVNYVYRLELMKEVLIFCWPCISIYLFININQLDAKLYYTVSAINTPIRGCPVHRLREFISCFYMFRAHVLIIRRSKLYYTVSGIITLIGGWPMYQIATYRCDDTRDCVIQFCPPDDEHMCLKQVEAWNKLIKKFSASSWLILINKYDERRL